MDPQKTPSQSPDERQDFHPDMTISPRSQQPGAVSTAPQAQQAVAAPTLPAPATEQPSQPQAAPNYPAPEEEDRFFRADDASEQPQDSDETFQSGPSHQQGHDTGKQVTWTASEFIHREKSPTWFMILAAVGIALSVTVYFMGRDIITTIITIFVVMLFAAGAARKPRTLPYAVDDHGVTVGNRKFDYSMFRSYAIDVEDHFHSINLMPMKRFMPVVSIYYALEDEDQIAEVLNAHLPVDTHTPDLIERLMRRIRF